MFNLEDFFNKIDIYYVWMCFTDKCTLDCDYCFFRYRSGRMTLPFERMKVLFDKFPRNKKYRFIFSGGEPLMEWEIVKQITGYIKKRFLNISLVLQTNGIFMDLEKVKFLKENNFTVEYGIDGTFVANFRHRKGLSEASFGKILDSINLILKNNLPVNPTMVVSPDQVKDIFENFLFLVSLGLYSIDVHPALLAPWKRKDIPLYLEGYKKVTNFELERRAFLVNKDYNDYSLLKGPYLDLIIMPDGGILPNWVYLLTTPSLKKKYSIFKICKDEVLCNYGSLGFILKKYLNFFKKPKVTYRDFSNFNVEIFLKEMNDRLSLQYYKNYRQICEGIRKIDQIVLVNTKWQKEKKKLI